MAVAAAAISEEIVTVAFAIAFVLATTAVTALPFSFVLATELSLEGGLGSFACAPARFADK